MKLKYGEKAKLSYMDRDIFIVYIKTEDIYLDIKKDVIGLIKDDLGGKIRKEFAVLKAKTYSYLTDNNNEDKKAKDTKKCVVKIKLKFED